MTFTEDQIWLCAWFGATAVLLFLKTLGVVSVQGYIRLTHRHFVIPEDAAFFGKREAQEAEHPIVQRAQRILGNDMENIPNFVALSIAYIALGGWALGGAVYFSIFVVSRIVHTLSYFYAVQPLRNRAYVMGLLVCLCLSGHIAWQIISIYLV